MRAPIVAMVVAVTMVGCVFHDADDGAGVDDIADTCADLDAESCRNTPACTLDICFTCSCAPSYVGCRGLTEPPHACPEVACPTPICCDDQADCSGAGFSCAGPNDAPGCGACNNDPGSCTTDADCGGPVNGMICEAIRCSCDGARTCVPGCTADSECGTGETCSPSTHRCTARACSSTAGCPPDFTCTDGACARTPCTDDSVCDGFCVNGFCEASLGECRPPVP